MKDALGHGSNTKGRGAYLRPDGRSVMPTVPVRGSGEYPARNTASDEAAAQALMSAKSSAVPIHPAMVAGRLNGSQADYTSAEYSALMKTPMTSNGRSVRDLISTLRSTMRQHPVEKYRGNPL